MNLIIIAALSAVALVLALLGLRRKAHVDVSVYERQIEELKGKLAQKEKESWENHSARIRAEAETQSMRDQLVAEKKTVEEVRARVNDTFKGLAANALEGNTRHFLELAKQFFEKHSEGIKGDFSQKHESLQGLIKPLKETLDKYQGHLRELENERQRSYTTVEAELKKVIETGSALSVETRALKDALKKPHVRGRWGEVQLKNCVELAGMSEFCDFSLQNGSATDDGRVLIPDLTVRMPGGRLVIVDAKTPTDAFFASLEARTDEARGAEIARHGRQVKEHVKKLAAKAYADNIAGSADFTVMFLPNESFLYAALETEVDLVEYGIQKNILLATPPTFIGLLKVILYGWNEQKLAQNAIEISTAGKELHKRLVDFVEAFVNIGKHLDRAKMEYDTGFSRLNSRVLVQARKMENLGAKGTRDLPESLGYVPLPALSEGEPEP